jgi:hypothetical protein
MIYCYLKWPDMCSRIAQDFPELLANSRNLQCFSDPEDLEHDHALGDVRSGRFERSAELFRRSILSNQESRDGDLHSTRVV